MKYTIFSTTNRPDCRTLEVAKLYQSLMKEKGVDAEILNLQDLPQKVAFSDVYGSRTPEFQKLQDIASATTKFIFIVPEYNGSIPGILKLFIDACVFPDTFTGKKGCMVGIADGNNGNRVGLEHLDDILSHLRTELLDKKVTIPKISEKLDENGILMDEQILKELTEQVESFMEF
ncbi:NAD(P)H-dependent oxidoreductase [bacterium AH-315-C07]|nr:NAD(P)H-dependent oxidoreductase [bacterium AH-315-C07]